MGLSPSSDSCFAELRAGKGPPRPATPACAASFKNVDQVHKLLAAGTPAITVNPGVVRAMIDHPGTAIAIDEFSADWKAAYGRDVLGM